MDGQLYRLEVKQHKLSFMYNANTGMVPQYIQDLIPPLVSKVSDNPYLLIEKLFHKNLVFHHPLDYGLLLPMI